MNRPDMIAVQSSQLTEIGYDETNARLYTRFQPNKTQREAGAAGSLYVYKDVPLDVWQALNAPGVSVGSLHIRLVKQAGFAFEKLEG